MTLTSRSNDGTNLRHFLLRVTLCLTVTASFFSRSAPYSVQIIYCDTPSDVTGGSIAYNDTGYNAVASYTCDEGFYMTGINYSTCQLNKQWTEHTNCTVYDCGTPPDVSHGLVSFSNTTYDFEASYVCSAGYNMSGNSSIRCQEGGNWTTSPVCNLIYCGVIPAVLNASVVGNDTYYGSQAVYTCDIGNNMVGHDTIVCGNSSWSLEPVCQVVKCSVPPLVANGNTIQNISTTTYGSNVLYGCNEGYYMMGNDTVVCSESGNWTTPPSCLRVDCGNVPLISNGTTTVINGTTLYEDQVLYRCQVGFNMSGSDTIFCQANATWSEPPKCNIVDCGEVPTIANTRHSSNLTIYASVASYSCSPEEGYLLVGEQNITCQPNGTWSLQPEGCIPVNCGLPPPIFGGVAIGNKTTFSSNFTYICDAGFAMNGDTDILCLANGTWSDTPTCTLLTTTTTKPPITYEPCTEEILYIQNPELEPNITVNTTVSGDYEISTIRCEDDENGVFKLRVVFGCSLANTSAGYVWWDLFCFPRPRRRRPPRVTGPAVIRPQREPKEAPGAAAIGGSQIVIVILFFLVIILLDLATFYRQFAYMYKNITGKSLTKKPRGKKAFKAAVATLITVKSLKAASLAAASNSVMPAGNLPPQQKLQSPKRRLDTAIGSCKTPTAHPNVNKPPSATSNVAKHCGTNIARRSQPAGKKEKELNKQLVQKHNNLSVKPEYVKFPNGVEHKKIYSA